ncbi:MAG: ankyrin repeat domain-containing protein [Bacteroidota bacterium]
MVKEKQADLYNAIRAGELEEVKEILKKTPDLLNEKDQRGSTPLLLATYYGEKPITKYLLSKKPLIDAQDNSGNTALMGVCFQGYYDIAKLLISNGANVNARNYNEATPLIYAAAFNRNRLVDLLLQNGADKSLSDKRGHTAADQAKMQGLTDIAEKL